MQNSAVRYATDFATEKLGTKVSIDHITIGMLNHIKVRGFYVEDMDRDTLLYASSVVAQIGPLASMKEHFTISSAKLSNAVLYLRETERDIINIKEVTDKISNPDRKKKGKFALKINSVDADSVSFRLQRFDDRRYESGVDYADMYLQNIKTHIDGLYVRSGGVVGGDITSLDFVEKSGFVLDNLSGRFMVDRGKISLTDVMIEAVGSQVYLPTILLTGESWESYHDFIRNVRLDIDVEKSLVTSDMVGYFAPQLWEWNTTISDATLSMHGTVANFKAKVDNLRLADGGTIKADATVRGLIDVARTRFNIRVKEVDVTTNEFTSLLSKIAHLEIPEKVKPYVERTNRLNIKGKFNGYISSFDATADIGVGSGGVLKAQCGMHPEEGARGVTATLTADSLCVNTLLAKPERMVADFNVKASALFGEQLEAQMSGAVDNLLFNGYNYNSIAFDGNYNSSGGMVNIGSSDKNIQATIRAAMSRKSGDAPYYSAVADVKRADLHALNINRRDTISTIKASMCLDAQGNTLDDMDGRLSLADVTYNYNGTELKSDIVNLTLDSNEDIRRMNLTSEFVDAIFESRCPYKDVAYYVSTLLSRYLPQLYDQDALERIESKKEVLKNKVAMLSVTAKDISPLLGCISSGVEVAPESNIKVYMAPAENIFMVRGSSECVEKYPYLISEVSLNANNKGDSLVLNLGSSELWAGAMRLSDFKLHGGAKRNRVDLYGEFADTLRDIRGNLAAKALLSRRNGLRHVSVDILPSKIGKDENVWEITSDGIEIDSTRIAVDRFRVFNTIEGQNLEVDGVASRLKSDSLQLHLSNFALTPFAQFAERIGYKIEGRTNGYATIRSAFNNPRIEANVDLDSVRVNSLPVPDMNLTSRWNFARSLANLYVTTRRDGKQVASGYLFPSRSRYFARLGLKDLDVSLIDPLLSGVLVGTEGSADVDLSLTGERRNASLNGEIVVHDMKTTLDYTKCTYSAPNAVIKVHNNRFLIDKAPIYDKNRNSGQLSMDLSLNHLSNIEYSLQAQFNNMQVMNTTSRDNDMFYGDMYASGDIRLSGDKAGVKMDITGVSGENSKFFMPLTDKSNITYADFVTFAKPSAVDTTNYLVRKKMMFERRQKQRASSGGSMDINMSLDVKDNTEVQLVIDPTVGDIIKATGNGLLNMRINPGADIFEMYGDYIISEGSYLFTLQNIINKKFVIERGSSIQWTGEPLDALLDIDAVYKVKASLQPLLEGYVDTSIPNRAVPVNCIINLSDRLTKPTVNFDVEVPSADASIQAVIANVLSTPERLSQQFLYLLITNSFLSENTTEASTIGVSSAATTGFELLSNQLSNWLSSESSNIILRYRPKTEQMMSDEVDFGLSQGLFNNRLLIEVEGNYLVDKSRVVNATSSFTGEAYVTWLIDRAGTLKTRGFTHTIDRFDENQGLQETGLGIYFKEDFDNAKDLKERLKNRFSRRRKRGQNQVDFLQTDKDAEALESMANGFDAPIMEDNVDNYD
ncbi:MAG: translocation/assembly module TamB domain-containing protein [Alistipes sp.]|nr:translocation/assembly module TamB domain-containing protein [Alistipes sp.]